MALANRDSYWTETNTRQQKVLDTYTKSGGKDRTRLKNMRADLKYSTGQVKNRVLAKHTK